MRIVLSILFGQFIFWSFSQGHEEWMEKINTVEDARLYASKHRDVLVSFVNQEKDRFLFDDIDTSNMQQYVGQSSTLFGRTTKLLKDTSVLMVDIQLIEFDVNASSEEASSVLRSQMLKKLREGESFWELKSLYAHTSAKFTSGPELIDDIRKRFNLDLQHSGSGSIYEVTERQGTRCILILSVSSHKVPAFYAISFNSMNE